MLVQKGEKKPQTQNNPKHFNQKSLEGFFFFKTVSNKNLIECYFDFSARSVVYSSL